MSDTVLIATGFVLALLGFGFFFVQARRNTVVQETLRNAIKAKREKESIAQKLERDLQKKISEHDKMQQSVIELDRVVNDLKQKVKSAETKSNSKASEKAQELEEALNEVDNYKEQVLALTKQVGELDQEKRELRLELKDQIDNASSKNKKELTELQDKVKTLKEDLKNKSKEAQKLSKDLAYQKEKAQKIDPVELKKMKRKLVQFSHFYMTMKGLKELAEERNENWQSALKFLSEWIIGKEQPDFLKNEHSIGPLVAKALEITGNDFNYHDTEHESSEVKEANKKASSEADELAKEMIQAKKELEEAPAAPSNV